MVGCKTASRRIIPLDEKKKKRGGGEAQEEEELLLEDDHQSEDDGSFMTHDEIIRENVRLTQLLLDVSFTCVCFVCLCCIGGLNVYDVHMLCTMNISLCVYVRVYLLTFVAVHFFCLFL